jgi:hypothetical protein
VIDQPVPVVDADDVRRIVSRDFDAVQQAQAMTTLEPLADLSPRVQLAVLKLADGDLETLMEGARLALVDYRDVLAPAEYPEWSDRVGFDEERFTEAQLLAIAAADWRQYISWLGREPMQDVELLP